MSHVDTNIKCNKIAQCYIYDVLVACLMKLLRRHVDHPQVVIAASAEEANTSNTVEARLQVIITSYSFHDITNKIWMA